MQVKLGISLQPQGRDCLVQSWRHFHLYFASKVAVLGQKGQVSVATFGLLQCRQQERLGCLCLQDLGLKCGI